VPNFQQSNFPTIGEIMDLTRSIVNDTFPGISGTTGRIFTDDAPFTIPFLNSALRKVQRKLRNEGVTFPIVDGALLNAIPAVVAPNSSVFINIGFSGTNNGTTNSPVPALPGDCMQVYSVRQRLSGSNLQFTPMQQSQGGLPSCYQGDGLGFWEWRKYAIWMNGSLQKYDLMIRYLSGQPPLNTPATDFDTTPIYILDCQDAVANLMAGMYGTARGVSDTTLAKTEADAQDAIDEMALEYIRRGQSVIYRRAAYSGSNNNVDGVGI
jgi:hypothetical protein